MTMIATLACRTVAASAVAMALWGGGAAHAQPAEPAEPAAEAGPPAEFLMTLSANPTACNLGKARTLDFATLAQRAQALRGACVAVRGWQRGSALYPTETAAMAAAHTGDETGPKIGIYARELGPLAGRPEAREVRLVGLVGTCEALYAQYAMVMGYCHYTGGPFVALAESPRRIPDR